MSETLPALLTDASQLDALSDPATSIILSLERSKEWLSIALANNDIDLILEIKASGEAARVYTIAKQLGKDAELAACEIVRRAERGLGLAIRKGQAEGRIATPGDHRSDLFRKADLISPKSLFSNHGEQSDSYALTNGISDDTFDAAISVAKAERNLSRANVKRKLRRERTPARWARLEELAAAGHTSAQIAQEIGAHRSTVVEKARALCIDIPADRVTANTRKLNHDRILTQFAGALEALVPSCEMIDARQISTDVLAECLAVMDEALREINRLRKRLRKGE